MDCSSLGSGRIGGRTVGELGTNVGSIGSIGLGAGSCFGSRFVVRLGTAWRCPTTSFGLALSLISKSIIRPVFFILDVYQLRLLFVAFSD